MRAFTRVSLVTGSAIAATAAFTAPALAAGATAPNSTTNPNQASASAAAVGSAADSADAPGAADAVFVQTDNLAGNQVAAYRRSFDGTLSLAHTYDTGGLGGMLSGSVVDHTASQGALTYDAAHGLLYAVNAGSDTVSVFAVCGTQLTLRQVVSSGGTFPVSVAVHGDAVYVLNSENGGSIQGYRIADGRLRLEAGWNRPLDLTSDNTFTDTPGQVGFTADGAQLLVTTKAAGNDVLVYGVGADGSPSRTATVNSYPGTLPFAFVDTGRHQIALVQAGTSTVVTYRVNGDGTLTQQASQATGQAATCWITRNGDLLYASNAGSASETGLALGARGALTDLGDTGTDPGAVDATSTGHNLYVQTGGSGVVDEYTIMADGALTRIGSVTVAGAAGGEGITVG